MMLFIAAMSELLQCPASPLNGAVSDSNLCVHVSPSTWASDTELLVPGGVGALMHGRGERDLGVCAGYEVVSSVLWQSSVWGCL